MKTLLIVTDNLINQINGVNTTYKSIQKIAETKGYIVKYITPDPYKNISCPYYSEVKLTLPINIKSVIDTINPDFIHIATEGPLGLMAKLYADKNKLNYTTAYHTKFPEIVNKITQLPESLSWKYIKWFHKKSHTVYSSKSMAVSLPFKNIRIWSRGVDKQIFNSSYRTNSDSYLLCVSRISKEKNLESFFRLPGKKIMVGDGPLKDYYKEKYSDTEFLGYLQGKDLANIYANASVFVFPSLQDTFGIVMIESMACGTPVVAYPANNSFEIIDNNKTGIIIDDLQSGIEKALLLNRKEIEDNSNQWSWETVWETFEKGIIKKIG